LKWSANNVEAERLARFVVAADFAGAEKARDTANAESKRAAASIATLQARVRELKALVRGVWTALARHVA
jgi:hypothetical protein